MDPQRVVAIREWPTPRTFKDIQIFLGFTNFYRGFIRDYSRIVAPITDLLKGMKNGVKKGPLDWTKEADQAMGELKSRFETGPLLYHFDPDAEVRVETDALGIVIGGIIS
jgi:hypothetical protein